MGCLTFHAIRAREFDTCRVFLVSLPTSTHICVRLSAVLFWQIVWPARAAAPRAAARNAETTLQSTDSADPPLSSALVSFLLSSSVLLLPPTLYDSRTWPILVLVRACTVLLWPLSDLCGPAAAASHECCTYYIPEDSVLLVTPESCTASLAKSHRLSLESRLNMFINDVDAREYT